ncbi:hypothetical protein C5167_042874 [Papaver somniferum]|uniref:1-phosphatidylinositol-4-phosphate 5-kinase n=1 Tax=Papaver somniferum TaxID=3469 RepID=A0A4Y7L422_PAPSO|nr:hypothetical protein C5167_042874 [Papaver somniferum]
MLESQSPKVQDIDELQKSTRKDLDLIFRLQTACFQKLQRQVYRDCDLQEQEKIMDYSLLVGFALVKRHIVEVYS